ncbi:unnamed protein product [Rotaria socialis]|uniref:Uncharacterized protein n=1 Tax=Rotaria socialis TaxID=392032 RepID=A0A821V3L2_9BILA|nr:unnamed protein product [Rotaria socialis]CAF4900592.1 unnamed protein product [Rotaria socialis]CAF4904454.1 unnamed protein product [Rotaria socialis]
MRKEEREALRLRVATFHKDTAGATTDLPRSCRPRKLNNKQTKSIAFTVNNNSGISHRILSRRYNVGHRTIGRNLKQRTNIRPRQRIKAPKYVKNQEKRAQKHCGF